MFTMRHALIAALAAGAVACGGAADDPDPGVTTSIGPAGGTVSHPDGVTLVVSEGALTTTQSITITRGGSSLAGTRMYAFEPGGLPFVASKIVTVSFPFDPGAMGTTNAAVYWSEPGTTTYDVLPATVAGTKASARVSNLSWGHVGGPCTANASCHPANECEVGVRTCSAGAPLCAEPVVVPDLTACTAGVCRAGACVAECNALSLEGAPTFESTFVSTLVTPVPVAAGGTVEPGTYVRTAVTVYGSGAGTAETYQGVLVISGSTVQGAYAAAVGIDRWTASLSIEGTSLATGGTCGFTETLTYGYTATTAGTVTELKLYFPDAHGNVFENVFRKQ